MPAGSKIQPKSVAISTSWPALTMPEKDEIDNVDDDGEQALASLVLQQTGGELPQNAVVEARVGWVERRGIRPEVLPRPGRPKVTRRTYPG